jgi:hypothetical protein
MDLSGNHLHVDPHVFCFLALLFLKSYITFSIQVYFIMMHIPNLSVMEGMIAMDTTINTAIAERIDALDWTCARKSLDEAGFAKLPRVLNANECQKLIAMYDQDTYYRKKIDMARYRFGEGEYKYFAAPLPSLIQDLRTHFYPQLAEAANNWLQMRGRDASYPLHLVDFLDKCHHHGQNKPTPLILKYDSGGYNCLHQDLYGTVYFPFQVVIVLNRCDVDYRGGEFMLVEQRPRAQSRGHVVTLEQGCGIIFPTQYRPVSGTRGYYQTTLRHGVSTVTSGVRYSLGIIFHDAE